tara:strand:+ start:189 stop:572 length:384 start_codon:yes stop_codon:yes gene_type:complete
MTQSMRLLIAALPLSFLPITVMAETKVESFTCEPWSNAGLRMRGDVKLELSGLNLMWTNGKVTQTAVMVNPEDKLEGNVSEAKRIYVAEDSTAVYFLKRLPTYLSINRTVVAVRETKQNTTYCHPIE